MNIIVPVALELKEEFLSDIMVTAFERRHDGDGHRKDCSDRTTTDTGPV